MPLRKKVLSIAAATAAFIALAAVAASLNGLEMTNTPIENASVSETVTGVSTGRDSVTGVTVVWRTDWNSDLGVDAVVGATLLPAEGTIHSTATVDVTIAGAAGDALGTMTSVDGGATWSAPPVAVPAGEAVAAAVVINDGDTIAAVTAPQ